MFDCMKDIFPVTSNVTLYENEDWIFGMSIKPKIKTIKENFTVLYNNHFIDSFQIKLFLRIFQLIQFLKKPKDLL